MEGNVSWTEPMDLLCSLLAWSLVFIHSFCGVSPPGQFRMLHKMKWWRHNNVQPWHRLIAGLLFFSD